MMFTDGIDRAMVRRIMKRNMIEDLRREGAHLRPLGRLRIWNIRNDFIASKVTAVIIATAVTGIAAAVLGHFGFWTWAH
jgi:hypothetical protein